MLADTWQLIRLYWTIDWREGSGQSRWLTILATITGVLVLLILGAASAAVGYGASFLNQLDAPLRPDPGIVPGIFLAMVMVGVLIVGLNQAVKSLFLSGDLDRLMVAPVHTRSVMIAKLLSRMPTNLILLLMIAAPAFIAYGVGVRAGPVYYLLGGILLLAAPFFGLSMGAIIAMGLVRLLPVNRLNELLAAAYAVLGVIFGLAVQLPRFIAGNEAYEAAAAGSFATVIQTMNRLPFPPFWAGRGLVALDRGRLDTTGLAGIGIFLAMTVGFFMVLIFTADRFYLSGWLKTQSAGTKRRSLDQDHGVLGRGSLTAAIGWKDWLLRLRDPRQLVSVLGSGLFALILGGLVIFRGSGGDENPIAAAVKGDFVAPGFFRFFTAGFSPGILMAGWAMFIGYTILSNTASYALAIEGGSFPLLKAAPVRPRDVWSAKVWSILLPFAVIFIIFLLLTRLVVPYDLRWLPYAIGVGLIIGLGLITACISIGFRYANLNWSDPRRMLTSSGGIVVLLVTIAYALPAGLLGLLPFSLARVWPAWSVPIALAGLGLLAAVTWGWTIAMQRWAENSWYKLPV